MKRRELNCSINHYYWLTIGLLLAVVILVSCSTAQPDIRGSESPLSAISLTATTTVTVIPVTPELSATPTSTNTATSIPSATLNSTATVTSIPSATPTSSPTPMPTLTPLPIVDPSQRGQVYYDLMSSNGGCELPCWWGFELGKTSIDEVRQFYDTFDVYIYEQSGENGISVLEATFIDPQIENNEQVRHSFVAQDDMMIEVEIQLNSLPNYQIEPILQRLGQPSEILMWTVPEPYFDRLPSDFLLYFPEHGVLVGYRTGGLKIDDTINVCFNGPGGATIHLWNPSVWDPTGIKGFVERTNESSSAFRTEGYHPINEASNWNVEQFYAVLTDPTHSECLTTPSSLWPPQL